MLLLNCICGNVAKKNGNLIFCGSGSYLCEREVIGTTKWNKETRELYKRKAVGLRNQAADLIKQAEKFEFLYNKEQTNADKE